MFLSVSKHNAAAMAEGATEFGTKKAINDKTTSLKARARIF